MIDYFALALTHVLIVVAMLRLLLRPELDRESTDDEAPLATDSAKRERGRKRRDA